MENITEKEFSKLKRRDLLELLLSQIQEDDRLERRGNVMATRIVRQEKSLTHLKEKLDEKDDQIGKLKKRLDEKDDQLGKLKKRLDEKDVQIEKLKKRLDEKDEQIKKLSETLQEERKTRRIDLEKAGSIADAALKLSGIFEAAQDAANRYLENLQIPSEKNKKSTGKVAEDSDRFAEELSKEAEQMTADAPEQPGRFPEEFPEEAEQSPEEGISQEVGADGDS